MPQFLRRMRYLLNRRQQDRELANEMEFHREMAELHGGTHFGNSLRLREEARDAWGWTWVERLAQDLRYASRKLRQTPGFTVAAILMLAIGIGANVAAFGFFNVIVLKPLAVRNPDTLLRFKRRAPQSYASQVPYPELDFFRRYTRTLSAVLGISGAKLTIDGEDKPLNASFVTSNLFAELGARMLAGRAFDPNLDSTHNADPVVVLSHGFWLRHFGSSPSAVGMTVRLNNKPATVIGIASEEFSGLSMDNPDLWAPITQQPYFLNGSQLLTDFSVNGPGVTMFGRLQPGSTALAAEGELATLAAELHRQHPADIWEQETLPSAPGGYAKSLGGGRHGTGRETSEDAYPLIGLVSALVLLILTVACGNLGSLLLARGAARQREITIRTAIGASTGRLVRQLFTESVLLGLLGSAAGLIVGHAVVRALMAATRTPTWIDASPDWRVVVFAIGMGFVSALLFGLAPALQVARQPHHGSGYAELKHTSGVRKMLVGSQIAASCMIVIVAALLVRALNHAVSASPGFEYQQVVSIDPGLGAHGYTAAQARNYLSALQNRLRSTPGIESVSMTSSAPLGNKKVITGADINGRSLDVHMYGVDPQFFHTMKIPLLRGSNLTPNDTHGIVISKSFASQWPTGDPLGRPFQMGDVTYTVIGVVGSARLVALEDADAVEAYYLAGKADFPSMVVVVKAAGPPEGLVPFVASLARSVDPKVFPEVALMKSSFQRKLDGPEHAAMAISVLGCLALLLACLGIVGLVTYAVSQRTREIGIRIALGANPAQIVGVVARQLTGPICWGLIAGVGGAAALSQVLRRLLYGISSLDPLAYVAAIAALALAVCVAAVLPARRALRIDPMQALRCD